MHIHNCHGSNLLCILLPNRFLTFIWIFGPNGDTTLKDSRNFVGRDMPREVGLRSRIGAIVTSMIWAYWILNYDCFLFRLKITYVSSGHLSSSTPSARPILYERSSLLKMCVWRQHTFSSETRLWLIPEAAILSSTVGLCSWVDLGSSCSLARLVLPLILWATEYAGHFVCFPSLYHTST